MTLMDQVGAAGCGEGNAGHAAPRKRRMVAFWPGGGPRDTRNLLGQRGDMVLERRGARHGRDGVRAGGLTHAVDVDGGEHAREAFLAGAADVFVVAL